MQEKIKSDGIRGIKQKMITTKEEAVAFANEQLT